MFKKFFFISLILATSVACGVAHQHNSIENSLFLLGRNQRSNELALQNALKDIKYLKNELKRTDKSRELIQNNKDNISAIWDLLEVLKGSASQVLNGDKKISNSVSGKSVDLINQNLGSNSFSWFIDYIIQSTHSMCSKKNTEIKLSKEDIQVVRRYFKDLNIEKSKKIIEIVRIFSGISSTFSGRDKMDLIREEIDNLEDDEDVRDYVEKRNSEANRIMQLVFSQKYERCMSQTDAMQEILAYTMPEIEKQLGKVKFKYFSYIHFLLIEKYSIQN